jgi:RHS repeat-associated protein
VVAGSDYTAYGEALEAPGAAPVSEVAGFGWAGEWLDPTGLVYLRARFYDPAAGVFLSVDSALASTGDRYSYAAGNPLQAADPLGLWPTWEDLASAADQFAVGAANFLYGAADALTFGLAALAVDGLGIESRYLDSCSSAFMWGSLAEMAAQLVVSIALTGGAATPAVLAGAAARTGIKAGLKQGAEQAGRRAFQNGLRHLRPGRTGAGKTPPAGKPSGGAQGAKGRGCRTRCFSPDTPVLLADGTAVPIGDIAEGDQVATTDPATGAQTTGTVTAVFAHNDQLVELTVGGETITTTATHPWWAENTQQWTTTSNLEPGDLLRTANGALNPVQSTTPLNTTSLVYDITVTPGHTYHIGTTQTLAHNCPVHRPDLDTLSAAGKAPAAGGRTAAGRAYQKHMDRGGRQLEPVKGKDTDRTGQELLDDILTDPGSRSFVPQGRFKSGGLGIVGTRLSPGGKRIGVVFDRNGQLKYFGVFN